MSLVAPAVLPFDVLCRCRRITGYTVEPEAGYLRARRPTLTYRMYRDPAGLGHARRFAADMARLGARLEAWPATGNLQVAGEIHRTRQVTVRATFAHHRSLARALSLVRRRYHAAGLRPVPGSWVIPDLRLTGCGPLPGTMAAFAQALRTPRGVAVTLTTEPILSLRGLHTYPVQVLDDWSALLAGWRMAA